MKDRTTLDDAIQTLSAVFSFLKDENKNLKGCSMRARLMKKINQQVRPDASNLFCKFAFVDKVIYY